MKQLALLSMVALLTAFTCEEGVGECESSEWINQQISTAEAQEGQQTLIEKYEYKGQVVFLIDNCVGCADAMQVAYTCYGEQLCQFGGIAGFNTCPDFADNAKLLEVVYNQ